MKKHTSFIVQITIALAIIIGLFVSGQAEAVTLKFQSSGKYAFVDFFNDSDVQMISGFVQVSDEMYKSAPGSPVRPGPMGILTIFIENREYPYNLNYILGTAIIELTSFKISGPLRSASAEGKGTLIWEKPYYYPYDPYYPPDPNLIPPYPPPYPPPPPPEEVTIIITWTGESDMTSGHNNFRSTYGDMRTHFHSSGTYRNATATGLIKGETFEVEVKPPPPPEPYPIPVPIEDPEDPIYIPPYPYPAPYPYAIIGKSKSINMFIDKLKP